MVRSLIGQEPVTVTFHAGTYYLADTIRFTRCEWGGFYYRITGKNAADVVISTGENETVSVTLSAVPGNPLPAKLFIQVRAK